MRDVVVVGGGIAGVAAAWFLRQQCGPEIDITIFEASPHIGGKLRTVEVAGLPVDTGAEAILTRRSEGLDLVRAAGLQARLRYATTASASLWSRGAMRPIPAGTVMGIPGDPSTLRGSGVLSTEACALLEAEPELPGPPLEEDVAVGEYVARRCGTELVERLVEPLLGGVYAGRSEQLSLQATVPVLVPHLRQDPSLVRAAAKVRSAAAGSSGPQFAGLEGGVGQLVPAVAKASSARVRTNATVRELRRSGSGWQLVVGSARDPEVISADAVVIACPATPASRLLAGVAPGAARLLAGIEYASMATVALAFPAAQVVDRLTGSGFLVPPAEKRLIKAATYSSSKWAWLGERQPDLAIVRCSVGRLGEVSDLQRSDDELVSGSLADLRDLIGLDAPLVDAYVQRWGGGLPQYEVGHTARVAAIRAEIARQPGLAVAGAAYDGVGIPACIASAQAAVTQLLATVSGPETMAP
jgi:oxygen-dependent protoporphyrinogen oxidase